jgi:hypothetical protein
MLYAPANIIDRKEPMNPLSRVFPGGVPIKCVFPDCGTTWVFNMTADPEKTNAVRQQAGWKYVQAVPTTAGLVWGWSCTDGTRHLTDGGKPYEHNEEIIHA